VCNLYRVADFNVKSSMLWSMTRVFATTTQQEHIRGSGSKRPSTSTIHHNMVVNYSVELDLAKGVCECEAGQQDGVGSHHPYHPTAKAIHVALDVKTAHSGITNTGRSEFEALSAQSGRYESAFVLLFDDHILLESSPKRRTTQANESDLATASRDRFGLVVEEREAHAM